MSVHKNTTTHAETSRIEKNGAQSIGSDLAKQADTAAPLKLSPKSPGSATEIGPFRADWRNPELYPKRGCEDRLRLAWEFLRRNADYAKHVQQMQALPEGEYESSLRAKTNSVLDGQVCWPPALPGERVKDYRARIKKSETGVRGHIAPPHKTFLNQWALARPVPVMTEYKNMAAQFVPPKVLSAPRVRLKSKRYPLMLYANEIALRFRLDIPAREQADAVTNILTKAAKRYKDAISKIPSGGVPGIKPHVSNFLARETDVMEHAHLWLRCHDAHHELKVPMVLIEQGSPLESQYKNRKRTLIHGPAKVLEKFAAEGLRKAGGSKFDVNDVKTFRAAADLYVNDVKYLTLLLPPAVRRPKKKVRSKRSDPG